MGGRGRGRGNAVSFNIEQLGFGRGEAGPVSVTQPPPLFPSLENRPLPLIKDVENEYILVTQKDLSTRMRNSPFYLKPSENTSYEKELPVLWNRMPAELRETLPKRLATGNSKVTLNAKKKKVEDPDKIFAKLEKKERTESEVEEDGDGKEDEDDQDKSDDEKVEMEDDVVEDDDPEMDDETDYANNYFENGEAYLDDEDGQDDGEAQF
ncbi:DNA-directed RNA polymerase III subunit RPC7-like isoform X2 [Daphnia pulex]|uniref:DNA-directed RNA polymerase III subunit RPC7-like isoform X2 n=1 Tax=Daphnia pulex TaxID=6669 RepID=UPI001EDEA4C0|nr:DNA-directed RNA polymerase III subunit RPC7-like isoform X2 [Daphnia pulex]